MSSSYLSEDIFAPQNAYLEISLLQKLFSYISNDTFGISLPKNEYVFILFTRRYLCSEKAYLEISLLPKLFTCISNDSLGISLPKKWICLHPTYLEISLLQKTLIRRYLCSKSLPLIYPMTYLGYRCPNINMSSSYTYLEISLLRKVYLGIFLL